MEKGRRATRWNGWDEEKEEEEGSGQGDKRCIEEGVLISEDGWMEGESRTGRKGGTEEVWGKEGRKIGKGGRGQGGGGRHEREREMSGGLSGWANEEIERDRERTLRKIPRPYRKINDWAEENSEKTHLKEQQHRTIRNIMEISYSTR